MALMPGMPGEMCDGQMDCGMNEQPPVGQQEQGPNSPTHGAAGGLDVQFTDVAPDLFTPASTSTGMTTSHPAFGRK